MKIWNFNETAAREILTLVTLTNKLHKLSWPKYIFSVLPTIQTNTICNFHPQKTGPTTTKPSQWIMRKGHCVCWLVSLCVLRSTNTTPTHVTHTIRNKIYIYYLLQELFIAFETLIIIIAILRLVMLWSQFRRQYSKDSGQIWSKKKLASLQGM